MAASGWLLWRSFTLLTVIAVHMLLTAGSSENRRWSVRQSNIVFLPQSTPTVFVEHLFWVHCIRAGRTLAA